MPEHVAESHPIDKYLREDRLPHIWCPGCGAGEIVTAYVNALIEAEADIKKQAMVCGIGCVGRISGYLKMDSFHTTHGRPIPFATGLKLANPKLDVTVISGDGDLFAIGGNHFIHAARRNMDMLVICSNNYIYGMTGGQVGPTTPLGSTATTAPYGNIEHPFNLVKLAAASGAVYVARWTSINVRRLTASIVEAMGKKGFRFIEVLSPCPTVYGRRNKMPGTTDMPDFFKEHTVIKHGLDPAETDIKAGEDIVLGKFIDVDAERESYTESIKKIMDKAMRK